jgi:hypothetical protein
MAELFSLMPGGVSCKADQMESNHGNSRSQIVISPKISAIDAPNAKNRNQATNSAEISSNLADFIFPGL